MIHRGSCVAISGRAIVIDGPAGIGKSSLALALMDRGAVLVSDDAVSLSRNVVYDKGDNRHHDYQLIASPAPNIQGLLEVRGVGLVSVPCCSAPVSLLIRLDEQAPRYIENPDWITLNECRIPAVTLYPEGYTLPLRAEMALATYGLPRSETE